MNLPLSLKNKTSPLLLMPRLGKISYLHGKKYVFSHCFVYWTDLYIYKLFDCVVPISSIIICFWSVWSVSYRKSCVKISCCEGGFLCHSSFINLGGFSICDCMRSSLELSYTACNEYFNSRLPFLSLVIFFLP